MTLCINNLDAPLGAEVRGIDVSRALTPAEVAAIEGAWRSRLVVVLRARNSRTRSSSPSAAISESSTRPGPILTGSRSTRSIRKST